MTNKKIINKKKLKKIINKKKFLEINEQIELLKSRGFNIKNECILKLYLEKYNYQCFVNGYNDLLLENEQRTSNKYKNNITEKELIQLFNFDKSISPLLLSHILDVERWMVSCLISIINYTLVNKFDDIYCRIFKLKDEWYKDLFSSAFKNNKGVKESKIMNEINDNLLFYWQKNKSDSLVKKYKNNEKEIPTWSLCMYWGLGNIENLLIKHLNNFYTNKFIEKFNIKFIKNIDDLKNFIFVIKKFRNKCCHNNVIYNYCVKLKKPLFDNKHYKLFDLVKLLDNVLDYKNKNQKYKLKYQINKKIRLYFNKEFNDDILELLKTKTNYYE